MTTSTSHGSQLVSLPKGGGAMSGIGEKFSPDLFTGTGNLSIPIATPAGRNGFQPDLKLTYSTGHGNGPFGLGWDLGVASISRKTDKGIPQYDDDLDVFILSGAEDLIRTSAKRHRPRTESLFAVIERQRDVMKNSWVVKSKEGFVSEYGAPSDTGAGLSVLADPNDASKIFSWKLSNTKDPFGNQIVFEYSNDLGDADGRLWSQVYLSSIKYVDYDNLGKTDFLVQVIFEYENRPDPFSQYRSGFEIRTTLRCKRILIKTMAGAERLVRAYNLIYADEVLLPDKQPANGMSLLAKVQLVGFNSERAEIVEVPPLDLHYSGFEPQSKTDLFKVGGDNLPFEELSNSDSELVDLTGNGLPDVVQMNGMARYWRNLGEGRFDLPRPLSDGPSGLRLSDNGVQMMDADGDGRVDLMVADGTLAGYFPMSRGAIWDRDSFQRYQSPPSFSLEDPEVRLLDLSGDGVIDALRSGTRLECFFNSAKQGWSKTSFVERKQLDEFPNVQFSDPRVRLGDMSGDGMQDIVLVHDGNVEYWANLGWGKWSKRVRMRGSPRFPFGYDPKQILLGDVDGDGLADMVLIEDRRVTIWINQAGNSWSKPFVIEGTPALSPLATVRLIDLMGSGMSGILWSLEANNIAPQRLYFLDLAAKGKPYLLTELDNNLGAKTRIQYASSIDSYLEDEANALTRWQTDLPFPVRVVKQVESIDEISRNKLTTRFKYHHGHWDGAEREFHGFGMVEQFDTETEFDYNAGGLHDSPDGFDQVVASSFSQPTVTKTWFYQGAVGAAEGDWHEVDYSHEYFDEDPQLFPRHPSLTSLSDDSRINRRIKRDALRAMRGMVLRTELYALDGELEERPYTVTEAQIAVQEIEPPALADENRQRIFFPYVVATRTTQWERGDDPMTRFTYTDYTDGTEAFDAFGRPRLQVEVALPRRSIKRRAIAGNINPNETRVLAICSQTEYAVSTVSDIYIRDRVSHTRTFELKDPPTVTEEQPDDVRQVMQDQLAAANAAHQQFRLAFGPLPAQLKLIGHTINHYDGKAFKGLDDPNLFEQYGALVRTESLVFDSSMLDEIYDDRRPVYLGGGATLPEIAPPSVKDNTGYRWETGSRSVYREGYYADTTRRQFDFQTDGAILKKGLVTATQDARGNTIVIDYDDFHFMPVKVVDGAGLETHVEYDYRLFQPQKITDANKNSTRVIYSPLGLPLKFYLEGRNGEGGTERNPEISYEYDFLSFLETRTIPAPQPIFVTTTRRIHHVHEGQSADVIMSKEFSDGFSRLVQTRTQAEDVRFGDPLFGGNIVSPDQNQADDTSFSGVINRDRLSPNVAVSGWQRYDNKGRVIEKWEQFFDVGWEYKPPSESYLAQSQTVSMKYDPRGQLIRTTNPDGSQQRVVFGIPANLGDPDVFAPTPWESYAYDENDNAGRTHQSVSETYRVHRNTPSSTVADALGRAVASIQRNGTDALTDWFVTQSRFDVRGNLLEITDPLGRAAFSYGHDLWNRPLRVKSIDAGLRTSVLDAVGNLIEFRDSRGCLVLREYDALNRLKSLWARNSVTESFTQREKLEYGDELIHAQAEQKNLLGKLTAHFDEAGVVRFAEYDFKGNLLEKSRQTIKDAEIANGWVADWNANGAELKLGNQIYLTTTKYDALNRLTEVLYPADVNNDQATLRPSYNRAGTLESVQFDEATYVERIAYNARGQRNFIAYGNGVITRCAYDAKTFRLARMRTERFAAASTQNEVVYNIQGNVLQDLAYEYDLAGNVLRITDRTKGCGVFENREADRITDQQLKELMISGDALVRKFAYDPLYRLTSASGREASNITPPRPVSDDTRDGFNSASHGTPSQDNAPNLSAPYTEDYSYDPAGNMLWLSHTQNAARWTRNFGVGNFNPEAWQQEWQAHLNTGAAWTRTVGNQLTHLGNDPAESSATHSFDANGNLIEENTERHFTWDHADRMIGFEVRPRNGTQASVQARYLYGADGMRVKKWVRRNEIAGSDQSAVYIGGIFEHHRWQENGATRANNHLHIMDNQKRIAVVRVGSQTADDVGPPVKYQLGDHLGSCSIVIGGEAANGNSFINREEYFPYGETSFGSFGRKRYRFSGKERDEESGLYYFGARFYAPHVCRWISCDPLRSSTETSPYTYAANSALNFIDKLGLATDPPSSEESGGEPPSVKDVDKQIAEIDAEGKTLRDQLDTKKPRATLEATQTGLEGEMTELKAKIPEKPEPKGGVWTTEDVAAYHKHKASEPDRKKLEGLKKAFEANKQEIEEIDRITKRLDELDRKFAALANKPSSSVSPGSAETFAKKGFFGRTRDALKGLFRRKPPSANTAAKEMNVIQKAKGAGGFALKALVFVMTVKIVGEVVFTDKTAEEGAKEFARGNAAGMALEATVEHGKEALEPGVSSFEDNFAPGIRFRDASIAAQME
jgi:RHS repeat-associated protein